MNDTQSKQLVNAVINNTNLNKIAAAGGSKYLTVAANTGLSLTSFYVRENTTITLLTGTVEGTATTVDLLANMAISGVTLIQGDFFSAPNGIRITAMTITAGSVIGYM